MSNTATSKMTSRQQRQYNKNLVDKLDKRNKFIKLSVAKDGSYITDREIDVKIVSNSWNKEAEPDGKPSPYHSQVFSKIARIFGEEQVIRKFLVENGADTTKVVDELMKVIISVDNYKTTMKNEVERECSSIESRKNFKEREENSKNDAISLKNMKTIFEIVRSEVKSRKGKPAESKAKTVEKNCRWWFENIPEGKYLDVSNFSKLTSDGKHDMGKKSKLKYITASEIKNKNCVEEIRVVSDKTHSFETFIRNLSLDLGRDMNNYVVKFRQSNLPLPVEKEMPLPTISASVR